MERARRNLALQTGVTRASDGHLLPLHLPLHLLRPRK